MLSLYKLFHYLIYSIFGATESIFAGTECTFNGSERTFGGSEYRIYAYSRENA